MPRKKSEAKKPKRRNRKPRVFSVGDGGQFPTMRALLDAQVLEHGDTIEVSDMLDEKVE